MADTKKTTNGRLTRAFDHVISFCSVMAMLSIVVMACLLNYDIVMRYVFNDPSDWVLDVVQLVQVTLAFMAAAPVLKAGKHIRMEVLEMFVGDEGNRWLAIVSNSICTLGSFWMAALAWRTFSKSYQLSESAYGITLPIYPWKFLVPLCFFILGIQFFALLRAQIRRRN